MILFIWCTAICSPPGRALQPGRAGLGVAPLVVLRALARPTARPAAPAALLGLWPPQGRLQSQQALAQEGVLRQVPLRPLPRKLNFKLKFKFEFKFRVKSKIKSKVKLKN